MRAAERQARSWSDELGRLSEGRIRVDGPGLLHERMALTGAVPRGALSAGGACRLLPCDDGWIAVSLPRPSDLELVDALIEQPLEPSADRWEAVSGWARPRTGEQIVERARLLGLAISRVGAPQPPLALPPSPTAPRRFGRPVVVDFSALWAGPLCARLLGLAGARVIKVESADRPDGARRGNPDFYDLLHHGHEAVVVEPDTAAGRRVLADLVAGADVVIEGSRPRALAGWGLDADQAVAGGATWVGITAYGRAQGDRIGFGDDVAAGAGMVTWREPSNPRQPSHPCFMGDAIADPLTGLAAAVAVMRVRTDDAPGGHLLDISMASVVASALAAENIYS